MWCFSLSRWRKMALSTLVPVTVNNLWTHVGACHHEHTLVPVTVNSHREQSVNKCLRGLTGTALRCIIRKIVYMRRRKRISVVFPWNGWCCLSPVAMAMWALWRRIITHILFIIEILNRQGVPSRYRMTMIMSHRVPRIYDAGRY